MPEKRKKILVLGGGFAGMYTARELENVLRPDEAEISLVNQENYSVYQPMLPEVISGSIGLTDVVSPIRRICPRSHLIMICTGTGSAPMRAMTEWRRRLRQSGKFEGGKLMLFFGARTPQELPYFGPLQNLPKDFIDIHFAFSREPQKPKRYVQDAMRERAADLAPMLQDPQAYFYVCGLKSMEEGVVMALRDIATAAGLDWSSVSQSLQREGRLHLETY